jgi:hypothetical protein
MKKFISMISLLGLSAAAMAQTIKIAPEVGGVYQTMSQKLIGSTRETQSQFGLRVGGVLDIGFNKHFSLQPGLFFVTNSGSESNYTYNYATGAGLPTSDQDRRRYHITYLKVPVYALYKSGKEYYDPHFFIGLGPYFAVALGGRFQQEYTNTLNGEDITKRYDYPMPFGNEPKDKMRLFDFGLQATAGYETSFGLYFRAFYGFGLLNVAPDGNADNNFHLQGGGISVGYFFDLSHKEPWEM